MTAAAPWATRLLADYRTLVRKLQSAAPYTPACTWHGLVEVPREVAKKKISSEEETWSDLSVLIFYNNLEASGKGGPGRGAAGASARPSGAVAGPPMRTVCPALPPRLPHLSPSDAGLTALGSTPTLHCPPPLQGVARMFEPWAADLQAANATLLSQVSGAVEEAFAALEPFVEEGDGGRTYAPYSSVDVPTRRAIQFAFYNVADALEQVGGAPAARPRMPPPALACL